ncbi:MAG: hypothetical protein FJZ11_02090, partial [Candidatus Omnitrophica bacterium]|nr:hypothetical protein [Candidatus Omnitrophota bacterium]
MNELKAFVCPACSWNSHGSNFRQERYPTASDYNSEIPRPHSIYFCNNCGLGIAYPELTESQLDSLYTEGNYWRNLETALSPKKSPGYYALAQARWNIVELFLNDRNKKERISILDIGAGHGFFGMVAAKSKNILIDKYCVVEKEPKFRESLTKTWPIYFPK